MCNPLWLCLCLLLPLALGENSTSSDVGTVGAAAPGGNSSDLLPTAEQLVRYRRHPPYRVRVGAKRGKQRRRTKSPLPKTKYGPPSYPPGPPVSYYKPAPPTYPAHLEEPSYSLDDFQHLKFDAADFQIPASSYEAQSMDLDLYGHNEPELYGAHKFPSLEYSFAGGHDSPPPSSLSSYDHQPHQKYGVPPQHPSVPSSGYGAPDSYAGQQYEAPPSTKYGVPSFTHAAAPPPPDSYSIYEQKIPNSGYREHFAEPPAHNANFEIAYSPPAYEISTSFQANAPQYEHKYPAPSPGQQDYQPSPPAHDYAPPPATSHDSYQPPVQDYQPPGHHGYQAPAPDSGHGYPPQEHAPDQSYQPPADQPSGHDFAEPPAPPQHPSSGFAQPDVHPGIHSYPQENFALPADELPLNTNQKFPSFDFPKSSYEVPIYDPIPFEASNKEQQESYPPILSDNNPSNELPPEDAHAAGSSRTPTKSRKRKRRPSVSKKHTLDVPELQQAYDADTHLHVRGTDRDTAAHGSSYVEQKRNYVTRPSTPARTTTTTTASPWSPMHVRTAFVPTVIPSTTPPSRSKSRGSSRYRSRNPVTETAASTVVTIEKSRSQSYYDGTLAPSTYQQQQQQQQQYPVVRGTRPTRPTQLRGALPPGTERNPTPKRTTKGVFDTTLFKSPLSDREMERKLQALRQNLPKNHKLY